MADLEDLDLTSTMEAAFDSATGAEPTMADALRGESAEEPADQVEEINEEITDQGDGEAAEPSQDPLEPPSRWSDEDKAAFPALPREAQEILLKRERDVESHLTQRTQELSEQSKRYEQLDELLAPRRQQFAMDGMDDIGAINQLFALSDYAAKDPAGFIQWFAQQRGVDLSSTNTGEVDDEFTDPDLAKLNQRLAAIEQRSHQAEQAQHQSVQAEYDRQISDFASEAGEDGQPLRPHFETVRSQMAALMSSGAASDLQHAYDMAVWANPETRKAMQELRAQAQEAEKLAAAKEAADKAKRAGGQGVQSKTGGKVKSTPRTMDETMSEAYDRAAGN